MDSVLVPEYTDEPNRESMPTLRDFRVVAEVAAWAKRYVMGSNVVSPVVRYAIGFYQLGSLARAVGCGSEHEAAEAAGAFCVHTLGACGVVRVYPCDRMSALWTSLRTAKLAQASTALLHHAAEVMRMMVYSQSGPGRRSRFSEDALEEHAAEAITLAQSVVPPAQRVHGLVTAAGMLMGKEWSKG